MSFRSPGWVSTWHVASSARLFPLELKVPVACVLQFLTTPPSVLWCSSTPRRAMSAVPFWVAFVSRPALPPVPVARFSAMVTKSRSSTVVVPDPASANRVDRPAVLPEKVEFVIVVRPRR